jgi:uncharacterized protein YkwD
MTRNIRGLVLALLACCASFAAMPSRADNRAVSGGVLRGSDRAASEGIPSGGDRAVTEGIHSGAVLFAVRVLREGGCGGTLPGAPQLHRNPLLDRSAQEWAVGRTLTEAVDFSGYHAVSAAGLHVRGPEAAMLQLLERSGCKTLASQALHEMGFYRRGFDTWIVLATEHEVMANAAPPAGSAKAPASRSAPRPGDDATEATSDPDVLAMPAAATLTPTSPRTPAARSSSGATASVPVPKSGLSPILATRALQLVNNVRARGTRCGNELFGPAPPVTLSNTLGSVAFGHADDMATNNYFEHEDLHGKSPSDRVRATGYQEKLVGENIAYGPKSVDEVVQGWLDSPGHCENIMDPRFVEMGLGYATSHDSKHALYWVQVLATPRKLEASTRSEPR